jgi:hypothetical protein
MRILFAIAHYQKQSPEGLYGSVAQSPEARAAALREQITSIHAIFGRSQCLIEHHRRRTLTVNDRDNNFVQIAICTTQGHHALEHIYKVEDRRAFHHVETGATPMLLPFECHALLGNNLEYDYDFYCYLEDDLIFHDPLFFQKLQWFVKHAGDDCLLLPNRFEFGLGYGFRKGYVDGPLIARATEKWQNVNDRTTIRGNCLDRGVDFTKTLNPHAGCFFLTKNQMQHWASRPWFLDRDTSFIGPLESAATLAMMKTFRMYKPAPANAGFLEIQHYGDIHLKKIIFTEEKKGGEKKPAAADAPASPDKTAGEKPTEPPAKERG